MERRVITIDWHSVLRDLLRNIWVIFCAAVIGVLGSYVVNHAVYRPEYTSAATVIVNSAEGKSNAVASLTMSSEIATVYAEVFVQPTMQKKVCEHLGRETFDGKIGARVNSGTNIMEISVTASNPEIAYRELRAILEVYPQITDNLYSNGVVSVLRAASVPKGPSNWMTSASVIKILVISMGLAAAAIAALSVMRDTVKGEQDFTQQIDAKLLGVIPHERKRMGIRDVLLRKKKGILLTESAFTSLRFSENFNKIDSKLEYMRRTKGDRVFMVTSTAENEGKSTVSSNLAISLLRKFIPDQVRIPAFIVVICTFVTMVQLLMQAFVPSLYESLGLFIPLIVVNCIILARAEAFARKNTPILSVADGLGMGIGFTLALTLMGAIRELIGEGSVFGFSVLGESYEPMILIILASGGFLTFGLLLGLFNLIVKKLDKKRALKEVQAA